MGKMKQLLENKIGYFVQAELVYLKEPYNETHIVTDIFDNFLSPDSLKSVINKVQPYINEPPSHAVLHIYDYYKTLDGQDYKQANRTIYMNKKQCKQSWIEIKFKKKL